MSEQARDTFEICGQDSASWLYEPHLEILDSNDSGIDTPKDSQSKVVVNQAELLQYWVRAIEAFKKKHATSVDFSPQFESELGVTDTLSSATERFLAALLACLICLGGAFWYRGHSWSKYSLQLDDSVRLESKETLPHLRLNGPALRMLQQELNKEQAINKLFEHSNSSAQLLSNLESFLTAIPANGGFRLRTMNIAGTHVVLRGEVDSLDKLDLLKKSLVDGGYIVGPDSTYANDFTLNLHKGNSQ